MSRNVIFSKDIPEIECRNGYLVLNGVNIWQLHVVLNIECCFKHFLMALNAVTAGEQDRQEEWNFFLLPLSLCHFKMPFCIKTVVNRKEVFALSEVS